MSKSEIFAWVCAIVANISVLLQIAINNKKTEHIKRLEGCIDAMIERQNNTNAVENAKFVIAK